MVTPRTLVVRCIVCLCLGSWLALGSHVNMPWAATTTVAEPTVTVPDLERLVQQIEDPQQRAQLVDTLRALIMVAKQGQAAVPSPQKADLSPDQSQGLFFAFGELTQQLATVGPKIGHAIAMLPTLLEELLARLRQAAKFSFVMSTVTSAVVLLIVGVILQLMAWRLERRLRARVLMNAPLRPWQKVWLALMTVGLAPAPYVGLLAISAVVFSIFPTGAMLAGLAALLIATLGMYRFARAVAHVLFDPDTSNARLLPIDDSTARHSWTWMVRLITLAAAYFLITRSLLTIGVAEESYRVVQGVMIIIVASALSVLILRLAQAQRTSLTIPLEDDRRRGSGGATAVQKIWPVIAIAYVWCAALLALISSQQGMAFMVAASLQVAMIIGVMVVLLWGVDLLYTRAVVLNNRVERYLPGLEARTLRYLRIMTGCIRALIIGVGLLSILQVWGIGIVWVLTSPWGSDLLARLIALLVTGGIVIFVVDLSSFIAQKLIDPARGAIEVSKKRQTLVPLTATAIKYGALLGGGLIVLHQVGINITPLLAGMGILSLAVGFGAQTLVKDIINGLFILVEDSISVGDVVNVRGSGGVVEAVNLRTIQLRDLHGSVHIIPNSQVEVITNLTKHYSYYLLDVGVAYHEDTDEVIAALQEIDAEMRGDPTFAADMLAPIEIWGVDRFTDSAVVIRARLKTKPIKQWFVGREFNRRMKKLFDARGIEIPFPQRTIHWGDRKPGQAVPIRLQSHNPEAVPTLAGREEGAGAADRERETPTQ